MKADELKISFLINIFINNSLEIPSVFVDFMRK